MTSAPVVVAARGDTDLVVADLIHQTVLVGDPTGPVAVEAMLEGFRFADAFVAVTLDVFAHCVDPLEDLAVLGLPPDVVFPAVSSQTSFIQPGPAGSRRRSRAG